MTQITPQHTTAPIPAPWHLMTPRQQLKLIERIQGAAWTIYVTTMALKRKEAAGG
jgi:hypothetical protein